MTDNSFNETDTVSLSFEQIDSPLKKNLVEQDFLHLMAEQIESQDMMQRQVNHEFLSQLAQFATHNGCIEMQESLQQMTTSLQSNQALQASALVGRKVLVESDILPLGAEVSVRVALDISSDLSMLRACVYAESKEMIKTISLGKPEPGFLQFSWDGIGYDGKKVKEGRYRIEVHAIYEDKEIALKTMILANVNSVSLGQNGEGLTLNVAGIGPISLNQVRQISV
ncbi:flagellar basal body rod modification protein FlgD [Legionella santicrucis]|uniref:Basal-body rod modification protein FlgD n=1 Tax=Legionella santicrucis TaxID=45074 RepID=A0A0W0YXS0_9GAMM|nr:flagellar hook assembly protein FlgD [Legionella santicrucis]KTD61455.1 flagellar basal body rod modification protein FlgD [Legionella santicrucis]